MIKKYNFEGIFSKSFEDVVKNDFGVCAQPLVSIEPEHIIIDELHLLLRICDKLLKNLILDTKTLDDKNDVHENSNGFVMSSLWFLWTLHHGQD
jgi:hypothetical protein